MSRLLLRSLLFLLICAPTAAFAKVRVVSTIPDLGALAREVGGDFVDVSALVRPTQDPHFLDAKPSYMIALNQADLVLLVGMELEAGWLPPLLVGSRNPKVQKGSAGYLDCATLIAPLEVQAVDRAKGDVHPGGNPHYWFDPRNGVRLARGLAARLGQLDAGHAAAYQKNAEAFVAKLEAKIGQWRAKLAAKKGTKVVVYHRSWSYLIDFAQLQIVGELEPKPGIPPSPDHVSALIGQVKDQGVRFVLQESYYPTKLSRLFAEKAGAALKVLPTMVANQDPGAYVALVDQLVEAIAN